MTDRTISFGNNDWRDLLISELRRTGGDPRQLFELLEAIVNERAWENLLDTDGQPVGSLRRLIEAPPPIGSGQKVDKVLKLLDVEHRYEREDNDWHQRMTVLRDAIRRELGEELGPLRETAGKPSNSDMSELKSDISKIGGNSANYLLARLKRDAPNIARQVIDGEITAAEGARRAGFKPRTATIYPDDLERTVKVLQKVFDRDDLYTLVKALLEGSEDDE